MWAFGGYHLWKSIRLLRNGKVYKPLVEIHTIVIIHNLVLNLISVDLKCKSLLISFITLKPPHDSENFDRHQVDTMRNGEQNIIKEKQKEKENDGNKIVEYQ